MILTWHGSLPNLLDLDLYNLEQKYKVIKLKDSVHFKFNYIYIYIYVHVTTGNLIVYYNQYLAKMPGSAAAITIF